MTFPREWTIFLAWFARCMSKDESSDSTEAQSLVKMLQNHITENHYLCINEILASLGQMYVATSTLRTTLISLLTVLLRLSVEQLWCIAVDVFEDYVTIVLKVFDMINVCVCNGSGVIKEEPPLDLHQMVVWNGGGEGNRTPVRRFGYTSFSEHRQCFEFPLVKRPQPGL